MNKAGKIIILSAPSGSGKSTIINRLMEIEDLNLGFSISCTSRAPREGEEDGRHYYFVSPEEFRHRVENNEFVEWEEVYAGTCYGTLRSEVTRVTGDEGKNLIMDVDVKGGMNIKSFYGDNALSIFIMPPNKEELRKRLTKRGTDAAEAIERRLAKADYEMSFAPEFDAVVVNDDIDKAVREVEKLIKQF